MSPATSGWRSTSLSPEQCKRVQVLEAQGVPIPAIAIRFGVSRKTIWVLLKEFHDGQDSRKAEREEKPVTPRAVKKRQPQRKQGARSRKKTTR